VTGLAIHLPETEDIRAHWDHVRANFGYHDPLYIIGQDELPDVPLVLLQPDNGKFIKGTVSLEQFEHPEDCVYLFGPDTYHLHPDLLGREPDHVVYIPTDTQRDMFSFVAYAVTMWDRKMKAV
jgi:tRNA(Leu) C34 or U34 (ribose-2'-O)-methylase TrmL